MSAPAYDGPWDQTVDLVVVGAGAGGMTAALVGTLHGLSVLLVERGGQVGGTMSTSAGTIWVPGSHQSARAGVPDRLDDARQYPSWRRAVKSASSPPSGTRTTTRTRRAPRWAAAPWSPSPSMDGSWGPTSRWSVRPAASSWCSAV